jgi:hypothetical protein
MINEYEAYLMEGNFLDCLMSRKRPEEDLKDFRE